MVPLMVPTNKIRSVGLYDPDNQINSGTLDVHGKQN